MKINESMIADLGEDQDKSSLVRNLISSQWGLVDQYNGMLMQAEQTNDPNLKGVLDTLLESAYISIGQLEGLLAESDPHASALETGEVSMSVGDPAELANGKPVDNGMMDGVATGMMGIPELPQMEIPMDAIAIDIDTIPGKPVPEEQPEKDSEMMKPKKVTPESIMKQKNEGYLREQTLAQAIAKDPRAKRDLKQMKEEESQDVEEDWMDDDDNVNLESLTEETLSRDEMFDKYGSDNMEYVNKMHPDDDIKLARDKKDYFAADDYNEEQVKKYLKQVDDYADREQD